MLSNSDSGNSAVENALEAAAEKMGITVQYDVYPDEQMMSVLNAKLATGNASDVIIHNIGVATLPAEKLSPLDGDWAEHISEQSKPMTVDKVVLFFVIPNLASFALGFTDWSFYDFM